MAADGGAKEVSSGHHGCIHSNGIRHGNVDGTLFDDLHNMFYRSVIAGIRLLVPMGISARE